MSETPTFADLARKDVKEMLDTYSGFVQWLAENKVTTRPEDLQAYNGKVVTVLDKLVSSQIMLLRAIEELS